MNSETKKQLSRAKALIKRKRYKQALSLLAEIDHPVADKWTKKLERRLSSSTTSVDLIKQKRKVRQPERKIALPDDSQNTPESKFSIWNMVKATFASLIFVFCGLIFLGLAIEDTQTNVDTVPTALPAMAIPETTVPATAIPATAIPATAVRYVIITRPPIRSGLQGQTYNYGSSSSSNNSSSSSSDSNRWSCTGDSYNCGYFTNRCSELQDYFSSCPGDPSGLDRDNNGIPCESTC